MALDIWAQKARAELGADRAGLARKTGGGRMIGTSPKGWSKAGLEGRKRWVLP